MHGVTMKFSVMMGYINYVSTKFKTVVFQYNK